MSITGNGLAKRTGACSFQRSGGFPASLKSPSASEGPLRNSQTPGPQ